MLLLAPVALAAPLAPSGLEASGVEVAAYTASQRAWLREGGCSGTGCDAWRADLLVGGEVALGIAAPIGVYVHAAYVNEEMEAAFYEADGYAAGAGARFTIPLRPLLAVHAWAGVEHQLTGNADLSEQVSAWAVDAGATLRGGRADDGFQAWVGVGVIPWSENRATVLDGDVSILLSARLPVDAVAGLMLSSAPLFGPWNDRTRLAAGVSASYGFRSGVTGFVSLLH